MAVSRPKIWETSYFLLLPQDSHPWSLCNEEALIGCGEVHMDSSIVSGKLLANGQHQFARCVSELSWKWTFQILVKLFVEQNEPSLLIPALVSHLFDQN